MKLSPLFKVMVVAGTCAVLASLGACGGGSTAAADTGGGSSDPVTSSSITLPSSVQVVTTN